MKLGIDARPFKYNITGIARYTLEISKLLHRYIEDLEIILYVNKNIKSLDILNSIINTGKSKIGKKIPTALWFETEFLKLCLEDQITHFWGTASVLPPLPAHVKSLLTVYDLNYKVVPESMSTPNLIYYRWGFERRIGKANKILAISSGTATRLKEHLNIEADAVARPAVSSQFKPASPLKIDSVKNKYKINKPYLLSVCTWEPRKNLELLVKTYLEMRERGVLHDVDLVLVGGKGWKDQKLSQMIEGYKGAGILPLGFVPDEDLPALYSGAEAFIFPSIYEGFGMPVLEARACGTIVVATDIPELREAGGPYGIYISPNSEELKKGIMTAYRLGNVIKAGRNTEPDEHSWETAAQTVANLLIN